MAQRGAWSRRSDAAASDLVGTILLVALVVVLGSLLAVLVTSTLEAPAPPRVAFSVVAVEPGDASADVLYRNGETLRLEGLRVAFTRNGSAEQAATPITPNAQVLRPGDRMTLQLSPPLAVDERLAVRIYHRESNALLTEVAARAGSGSAALAPPTMTLALSVGALPNDSVSSSLLTARVSHPAGALAVARVVADLSSLSTASTSPFTVDLVDTGTSGDAVGGDGVWTAALRVPTRTPSGAYTVRVNATDAAGRLAATGTVPLSVTPSPATAGGGSGGNATPTYGNATITGGQCYNCTILGGFRSYEGTRFMVPTSANTTSLTLKNFTWDKLHPDRLDDDAMVFRITDSNRTFSVYMTFGYATTDDVPTMKMLRMWHAQNETIYKPRVGLGVPLTNLTINLLNVTASNQWIRDIGTPDGSAYYTKAAIVEPATLIMAFMRDERATASTNEALDVGIFAVDLEIL